MSVSFRRFEILLPRKYNDGQPVPDAAIADTLLELEARFGAVSSETQVIHGLWRFEGQLYRDDLVRVFVDVPDDGDTRQFMIEFKVRMKERFHWTLRSLGCVAYGMVERAHESDGN